MTRLRRQQTRWEVEPGFESLLDAVLAAPGRVVKESPAKLVTEHRAGGGSFFVKRYRHGAFPFRPLKFFFKASQARQEWRLARELTAHGIPMVRHVALGERWSARGLEESILITEAFAGVSANEAADLDPNALVAFVERMASAGIVQEDLHPANLLVQRTPLEIRLVDLHGIRVLTNASETERRGHCSRMLALLRMTLPLEVPADVESMAHELRKKALRKRSRRCLKTNRDFSRQQFGAWRWTVRRSAITAPLSELMASPDDFFAGAESLKRGRSSTVAARGGVVLKRYNFKKPFNLFKDLFRGSRARRGFRKGYHLEICGVATPRVIATADHRVAGFPTRSYLLMEKIPDAVHASQWNGDPRRAAGALATLLARLHEEGFTHRDLKETNLLFDLAGVPYLIDLDGLKFVAEVDNSEAAANLERLAAGLAGQGKLTRANTIVFLLRYCRRRRLRPRQLFPRRAR